MKPRKIWPLIFKLPRTDDGYFPGRPRQAAAGGSPGSRLFRGRHGPRTQDHPGERGPGPGRRLPGPRPCWPGTSSIWARPWPGWKATKCAACLICVRACPFDDPLYQRGRLFGNRSGQVPRVRHSARPNARPRPYNSCSLRMTRSWPNSRDSWKGWWPNGNL